MNFGALFQNVNIPILVYEDGNDATVVYQNASATSLLDPIRGDDPCPWVKENVSINQLLKMPQEEFELLSKQLHQRREAVEMRTKIQVNTGDRVTVLISANRLQMEEGSYVKLCIYAQNNNQICATHAQLLTAALSAAYEEDETENRIQKILQSLGQSMNVSRIYIVEPVSETDVRYTYEWCRAEQEGEVKRLQDRTDKLPVDAGTASQLENEKDSGASVNEDQVAVEFGGFQSMLSVPIVCNNDLLGNIVLEDCAHCRQWTTGEIQLIQSFAEPLAFFMKQKQKEYALHCEAFILHAVMDQVEDIVYIEDVLTKQILFANLALSEALSISREEIKGQDSSKIMQKFGRYAAEELPLQYHIGKNTERHRKHTFEFFNQKNGKWYLVRHGMMKWTDGKDAYFENMTDISALKKQEAKLERIASTDRMTGVYNRDWGRKMIEQILENKDSGKKTSLVFLDLDNLKCVNDRFGHTIGDQMIIKTVSTIQSCIRKSDALCRWGGDEFVMLLRAKEEDTHAIMQKIQSAMEEYNATGLSLYQLGFSYGIVEINAQTRHTMDSLIAEADQKMYVNKLERSHQAQLE